MDSARAALLDDSQGDGQRVPGLAGPGPQHATRREPLDRSAGAAPREPRAPSLAPPPEDPVTQISAALVKQLRDKIGAGMGACKKALIEAEGDLQKAEDILRAKGVKPDTASRKTAEGMVRFSLSDDGKRLAVVELQCETDFAAKNERFQNLLATIAERTLAGGFQNAEEAKQDEEIAKGLQEAIAVTIRENIVLAEATTRVLEGEGRIGTYVHHTGKIGVALGANASAEVAAKPEFAELLKDLCMHATAHHPAPIAVDKEDIPEDVVARERAVALASINENPKNAAKPDDIKEKMIAGKLRKFYEERALLEQKFVKDPNLKVRDLVAKRGKELGGEIKIAWFVRQVVGE
ncbi:MAG: translation elongation factor Ts [Planctomycetota bacterium]|nr:MAG: translation elongation factor Ts [Planctomycetota bacterium]